MIDGLVVTLDSNVINHDCAVVAADCEKCGELRVEIQAHNTRLSIELELRECGVLDGETTNETSVLLQEVIRTIANSEQITVSRVPADGGNMLLTRSLS